MIKIFLTIHVLFFYSYDALMCQDEREIRLFTGNSFLHNYLLRSKILQDSVVEFSQVTLPGFDRLADEFSVLGKKIYIRYSIPKERWPEWIEGGAYIESWNDTTIFNFKSIGRYCYNEEEIAFSYLFYDYSLKKSFARDLVFEWSCLASLENGIYSFADTNQFGRDCFYMLPSDKIDRVIYSNQYKILDTSLVERVDANGEEYVKYDKDILLEGKVDWNVPQSIPVYLDPCKTYFYVDLLKGRLVRFDVYEEILVYNIPFKWSHQIYPVDDGYYAHYEKRNMALIIKYFYKGGYEVVDIVPKYEPRGY